MKRRHSRRSAQSRQRGFLLNPFRFGPSGPPAPAYDPDYWRNALLLHMEGENASTTILDSSRIPLVPTINGNAKLSTAKSKFGAASLALDGAGDWIYYAPTSGLDLRGDFTIECFVNWATITNGGIFHLYPGTPPNVVGGLAVGHDGTNFGIYYAGVFTLRAYTISTDRWYHIALVRVSGSISLYIDGVKLGASISDSTNYLGNGLSVGLYYGAAYTLNGNIDEFRVTRDLARYTADFTPPAAPFLGGAPDPDYAKVSLLLYLDGNDASTAIRDSSPAPKTGTAVGNAQIDRDQSKFGGASLLLDGTGDGIDYAESSGFGFGSGDYTVEGWLRQANNLRACCLFDNRVTGGAGIAIYSSVNQESQRNRLILASNTAVIAGDSSTQFNAATNFQHWAVTKSGTTVRGFIDGALVWTITDSRTLASTAAVRIGRSTTGQEFIGHIDELRVTKGVARYTAAFTPPAAPFSNSVPDGKDVFYDRVALLLPMNGPDGSTTFSDVSASPKAATVSGNAQLSTAQAKFGGSSAAFDGSGDFVQFGAPTDFHIANLDFTIEGWLYMTLDATRQKTILATRAIIGTNQGYELFVTSANAIRFSAYLNDAFPIDILSTNGAIPANVWTHFAVSRDGPNTRLFVNGVQVGIDSTSGAIGQGVALYLARLTTLNTTTDWPGYLDDIRITLGVGRYNANFTPPAKAFPTS